MGDHADIDHSGLTGIGATDHGALTGLSDDDHPQYVKDSEFSAKGRILVGTGSGTFTALAVGTDGHRLVADSAEASGVKWAAAGAATITVEEDGETPVTGVDHIVFDGATVTDDGGGQVTVAVTGGPGGGAHAPSLDRWHIGAFSSTTSHVTTITAAAVGQRMIVAVGSYNRDVTGVSCTNVTFTEVLAANQSTSAYVSVYVGVVAGGASGTSVTVTAGSADQIFTTVIIVDDALTPTAVDSASVANASANNIRNTVVGPIDCSVGDFLIMAYATNNATSAVPQLEASSPLFLIPPDSLHGLRVAIGIAGGTKVSGYFTGGTDGNPAVCAIAAVS